MLVLVGKRNQAVVSSDHTKIKAYTVWVGTVLEIYGIFVPKLVQREPQRGRGSF